MSKKSVKAIYYYPADADLTILKKVFSEMRLGFKVMPYAWEPGLPGPILFIPKKPSDTFPYVLDHAKVTSEKTAEHALRWALGVQHYEKGPNFMRDNLAKIFGQGIREIKNDNRHDGV